MTEYVTVDQDGATQRPENELVVAWVEALRSGMFNRATGALYDIDADNGEGQGGYCCLGVADKVCFNATFKPTEQRSFEYEDDLGNEAFLDDSRSRPLNLHMTIVSSEYSYFQKRFGITPDGTTRQNALATMNDEGFTFSEIADAIEGLEWHLEPTRESA